MDSAALLQVAAREGSRQQHKEEPLRHAETVVSETALQRLNFLDADQDLAQEGDPALPVLAASVASEQQQGEE